MAGSIAGRPLNDASRIEWSHKVTREWSAAKAASTIWKRGPDAFGLEKIDCRDLPDHGNRLMDFGRVKTQSPDYLGPKCPDFRKSTRREPS